MSAETAADFVGPPLCGLAKRRATLAAKAQREAAVRAAIENARIERMSYARGLREQIRKLEAKLNSLERDELIADAAVALDGKRLLRHNEIVAASQPVQELSGVYFLLKGATVVYVGQAVNVPARINDHLRTRGKAFDRFAYVLCQEHYLDRLESLYIHVLEPALNGTLANGRKCAPLSLEALIGRPDPRRKPRIGSTPEPRHP